MNKLSPIRSMARFFRKFLTLKTLVILVVAGFLIYSFVQARQPQKLTADVLSQLKPINAQIEDLTQVVIASGKLESNNQRTVVANYTGTILELKYYINDTVKKNDIIAKIEEVNPVSKAKTTRNLKAPAAGTIIASPLNVGAPVVANQTTVYELADINDLKITADVVEADINKIAIDQAVKITFVATGSSQVTQGKISSIAIAPISITNKTTATNTGSSTGGNTSQSYRVTVKLTEKPQSYRLGYSADLEIETARKNKALSINDSYIFKQDGKFYVKLVGKDAKGELVLIDQEVTLGFRGESDAEILTGLKEGDQIVLPSAELLAQHSGTSFGFSK